MFLENFDAAMVEKLKPFVLSNDFRQAAEKYPSYYLLALIQEWTKAPPYFIGHSYLRASWQLEHKPQAMNQCLERALANLSTAFATMKRGEKETVNTALLLGELERRLGRFEAAAERFRDLRSADEFKDAAFQKLIGRELELISAKVSEPRSIDPRLDAEAAAPPATLTETKPKKP